MNHYSLSLLLAILFTMSACVKPEKKTLSLKNDPLMERLESIAKKKGYKCDFISEADNKELFLQMVEKDGNKNLNIYDFISANKIPISGAHFGDYSLLSITMEQSPEDAQVLIGEGILIHADPNSLSNEGKVLTIISRLTLNEDMSGKLEQKLLLVMDDNSTKSTEFQEIAKIENCEDFVARWM
jgi:hypothetical protein